MTSSSMDDARTDTFDVPSGFLGTKWGMSKDDIIAEMQKAGFRLTRINAELQSIEEEYLIGERSAESAKPFDVDSAVEFTSGGNRYTFCFYDNRLFRVYIDFGPHARTKAGFVAIYDDITKRLGKPTVNLSTEILAGARWETAASNVSLAFWEDFSGSSLQYQGNQIMGKRLLADREKKATKFAGEKDQARKKVGAF
jgi:hypothetical protein